MLFFVIGYFGVDFNFIYFFDIKRIILVSINKEKKENVRSSKKEGKDSDYAGGKALRSVDKRLQGWGMSRDSRIIRAGHAIEHTRRGMIASLQGDHERAEAEYQRARSNRSPERNPENDKK